MQVAGTGGGALLDEHDEQGVEAAKQRVGATGGQARAGGALQNQLAALRRAVHRPAEATPHPPPQFPTKLAMAAYDVMFQVFQAFQTYISSVSSGCCKSRSGMLHMLQ